jgi:hypothetical protein
MQQSRRLCNTPKAKGGESNQRARVRTLGAVCTALTMTLTADAVSFA